MFSNSKLCTAHMFAFRAFVRLRLVRLRLPSARPSIRAAAAPPLIACACRPLLSAARTTAASVAALGAHRFAALRSARSSRFPRRCAPRRSLCRFALAGRAGGFPSFLRPTPRRRLCAVLVVSFYKVVGVGSRRRRVVACLARRRRLCAVSRVVLRCSRAFVLCARPRRRGLSPLTLRAV